jgi:hypothetical protein
MDRQVVTGMVEDYWRALIPAMQTGGAETAFGVSQRFEERVEETASLMPPLEAAAFRQSVEAERERLMAEYQSNPVALKQRLGVDMGIDGPQPRARASSSMGDLVVRTAVRATIWESVWSLFRVFR